MVLRFTARVQKREVRVREIDLPDGAVVDVTIHPHGVGMFEDTELNFDELSPDVQAMIREGERDIRAGRVISGDEFLAYLRDLSARDRGDIPGATRSRSRDRALGGARPGAAKSTTRRARGSARVPRASSAGRSRG
jgi:hypothetical protein